MWRQEDRDTKYTITISGIPTKVLRQEEPWRIIKDVIRKAIEGQPQSVKFSPDGLVAVCTVRGEKDAERAVSNLAGRDWWSLQTKNYTVNEPAAILEVGFSKHIGRGGQIEYIKGPTTQPVSSPNHGVYATSVHLRNSSSISRSSYIESPRQSMQSIGYQSVVNAQSSQAGKPSNPTFQSQSHSSWRDPQYNAKLEETVNYHNKAPPNTPSRKREPAKGLGEHKEVIIRNLQLVVTKKTVRAALMEKVGIIDSCEIEVDGESRLCATVGFAEGRDALKAVRQLHKTQFLGTLVSVQLTEKEGRNPVIINNSISDFDSGGEVMGHRHRQGNF